MKNTFWKIIFVIYTFMLVGFAFSVTLAPVLHGEDFTLKYILVLPLYIFSAVIIYFRAWDKKVLTEVIWRKIFIAFILVELALVFFGLEINLPMQILVVFAFWGYIKSFSQAKENVPVKFSILAWRVFFYAVSFMFAVSTLVLLFGPSEVVLEIAAGIPLWFLYLGQSFFLLNLIGFYGFLWEKKILSRIFWQGFFAALIVLTIISLVIIEYTSTVELVFVGGFSVAVIIPVYLYAFRRKELWT